MKKLIIAGLATMMYLTGCQQGKQSLSQNELFEKKTICASYKTAIETSLAQRSKQAFVDEIFFSPSMNTCLYSAAFPFEDNKGLHSASTIEDFLTNKQIFRCVETDKNCETEYENKKNEFKK